MHGNLDPARHSPLYSAQHRIVEPRAQLRAHVLIGRTPRFGSAHVLRELRRSDRDDMLDLGGRQKSVDGEDAALRAEDAHGAGLRGSRLVARAAPLRAAGGIAAQRELAARAAAQQREPQQPGPAHLI
jgi:hypothetical protein